jgi:hypothetical protein
MFKLFPAKKQDQPSRKSVDSPPSATSSIAKDRERRRQLKNSMPRTLLDEVHTAEARILPSRQSLLQRLPSNGVACEIGVASGEFTADIISLNRPAKLHLIDAWSDERYAPDKLKVLNTFKNEIDAGTVEINEGLSTDALAKFPLAYFDWVYIDTDHSYKTTSEELALARDRVKPGGRIAGHDFCTGNVVRPVPYGVIEACHEFCAGNDWRYEFITLDPDGHFSFCLKQIR